MVKEDGSSAKLDEKLDFKVLEFNKTSKRIILSHSRTFEDQRKEELPVKPRSASEETKLAAKKLKASLEKTTFGDITELVALKEEMEATEKKGTRKKTKSVEPKKPKKEAPAKLDTDAEPTVDATEPFVEPVEPTAEVVEPTVETTEQVAEIVETEAEVAEPVAETSEPIAEAEPAQTENVEVSEPKADESVSDKE
jgi:hypothetical protein